MSVKAVVYPVQGRNLMICTTRTDPPLNLRMKLERAAEKNTSNGILAKNNLAK
jgi:hypothetical protein